MFGPFGTHDLRGDVKQTVEFEVFRHGGRSFADLKDPSSVRRQHDRSDLMRGQRLANRGPRGVAAPVQEGLLDRHQQVVRQHA